MEGLAAMLGIWAVRLGQPPCKSAGLKRKSNMVLEFRAASRAAQSPEGFAKRDSIVKPLSSSVCNPLGSLSLSPCVLESGCSRRVVGQCLHSFHCLCEPRDQLWSDL